MGNQLLKKLLLALIVSGGTMLCAETTIKQIDRLVQDIKEERVGLTPEQIKKAKDPFIYFGKTGSKLFVPTARPTTVKVGKKRYRFTLTAIVNDRVKLNRRWYHIGDKIYGFKIMRVANGSVYLQRGRESIRIFMHRRPNKKIKLFIK